MAQIFNVTCPRCRGKFPCHPELWQVEYKLLCPFCQLYFAQEESPMITTGTGESRPGSQFGRGEYAAAAAASADASSQAESM
jgi:hypothetical protein